MICRARSGDGRFDMSLKQQITEDMKSAMRARETARLGAIRLLLAAMKQRRDSISQFEAAGRQDLVDVEKFEVSVLQTYMPQQLSEAEIIAAIAEAIAATGAAGPQDMGKVMGVVKPKLAGRADMGKVSGLIKAQLTK